MIRVLHLRDTARLCGPGKTIVETACAVDKNQFHLSVGAFSEPGRESDYMKVVRSRGIDLHAIPAAFGWDPRLIGRVAKLVRSQQIDIVHSHDYMTDILTSVLPMFVPVATMSTVHGWITNTWRSQLYVKASQFALRRLDRVVAVSEETKKRVLASGVTPERLVVIHNAIVAKNYRAPDHEPGVFRRQYGIPPTAVLLGSVGRLSPEKGQRNLLHAVARVAAGTPRVHLVLAGDGPDTDGLKALAGELGIATRVTFTGHLGDVRPLYRDLDILALTSFTEGFPNVILEALCMDVPVLACDVGGVREIVVNRETGMLVEPGSVPGIERALIELITDPLRAKQMASAGKAKVFDMFEFERRTRKEEEIYRALASDA